MLHTDRNHPHVHIVYNCVDNSGSTIDNYNLWEKHHRVCREMTERYGYHMGKVKERVNRQALRGKEKVRYAIYDALKQAAAKATSWRQLEALLAAKGIGLRYKYRSGTSEVQGDILKAMGQGKPISIVPVATEVTTQKAAEILGCSRPHLVRLLEEGKIAFTKVGKHRRIKFEDVIKYKEQMRGEQQQHIIDIMNFDEEMGLYDS